MIGLKRHTVQVVEHQPEWSVLFKVEADALSRLIGDLVVDIQHVGSTAVPDLPAKPILDIAAAVDSPEVIPRIVERLVKGKYIDRGDGGRDGGYLLVKDSEPDVRTVHLHIVEQTDIQWQNYIDFRDILLRDDGIRCEYARLKTRLAAQFPHDRKSYTDGKNEFIRRTLSKKAQPSGGADAR
jgi:GrpB-like predicted nucleotidyltransferase (UPF0157 family)